MFKQSLIWLLLLVLFPALGGCPAGTQQKPLPPLFYFAFAMETREAPSFLITDDFNRDGKLDLVVTNSGDHSFSFYKGQGDGTFQEQKIFKTGHDPICVVAADFNNDGYKDLAELNYSDQTIRIFLNTRLGSFIPTKQVIEPGKVPINLTAGDFNEDGFPDLAVTMRYHKVVIILGNGNGYFGEPVPLPVNGQPTALVVGDYNHDGHVDVAIALAGSGNRGVQILWGAGDGTFEVSKMFKGGGQPLTLANIDANGDGFDDLVSSSNVLHSMTMTMNNKDKTFSALKDFASGNFPKYVAVADFTGDGNLDLAVSNSTDDMISVSLGRGDGTFLYPPIYHAVEEHPQGIATGDFNGDGLIDLAISCRDKRSIDILLKKNMVNPDPNAPPAKA
jgi:hypothetical protein